MMKPVGTQNITIKLGWVLVLTLISLAIAACGGDSATLEPTSPTPATQEPTATPRIVATQESPATVSPSTTVMAVSTPVPATPEPTKTPDPAPTSVWPTPVETPEAEATHEPRSYTNPAVAHRGLDCRT